MPLPFIYPIIVYNGYTPYKTKPDIYSLFGGLEDLARHVCAQPITLIDVNQLSDDDIRKHNLAGLLELSLCRSIARHLDQEMILLAEFYLKYHNHVDSELFETVVKYGVFKWDESALNPNDYLVKAQQLLPHQLEEKTMTFAESFIAVGKEMGQEIGKKIGKEMGQKEGVERAVQAISLLNKNTDPEEVAKITALDIDSVFALKNQLGF